MQKINISTLESLISPIQNLIQKVLCVSRLTIEHDTDSEFIESEVPLRSNSQANIHLTSHYSKEENEQCEKIETTVEDKNHVEGKFCEDKSFIEFLTSSNGPPQVIFIGLLLATAFGSSVGVVPAVTTDQYARIHHGYEGESCYSFTQSNKPFECQQGSQDAQDASAISSLFSNLVLFVTSCLIGSISDARGRKPIIILGVSLSLLSPLFLVLMQINPELDPSWYYVASSFSGAINWMSVTLSSLSDVVPPHYRAPSFGVQLAGFALGFGFSPVFSVIFGHFGVSLFSLSLLLSVLLFVVFYVPETLPKEVALEALKIRKAEAARYNTLRDRIVHSLLRPIRELSIINRNGLFRLLSLLAFLSGISSSADQTLFLYYIEDVLSFSDNDIALFFVVFGLSSVFVQILILKPLNDRIGERFVMMIAFAAGAFANVSYGLAQKKSTIFFSATVGSLLSMSFPTLSAIKSNNVDESEQGRIQGALYSLSSLASAIGPISMRFVYYQTEDYSYPGPGTMFIFAGSLYFVAIFIAGHLPEDRSNSKFARKNKELDIEKQNRMNGNTSTNLSYGSIDAESNML